VVVYAGQTVVIDPSQTQLSPQQLEVLECCFPEQWGELTAAFTDSANPLATGPDLLVHTSIPGARVARIDSLGRIGSADRVPDQIDALGRVVADYQMPAETFVVRFKRLSTSPIGTATEYTG
jgi:hypothetical protein